MKQENELICEFMGEHPVKTGKRFTLEEYLNSGLYHTSWDWLMPVVEKIESLGFYFVTTNGEDGNEVMIHNEFYSYKRNDTTLVIGVNFLPKEVTKLQSMYKAVVDFIKWYNSQKP